MQREAQQLVDSAVQLSYWMRGGATYTEIMNMTPGERDRLGTFLEKRLEQESKRSFPMY